MGGIKIRKSPSIRRLPTYLYKLKEMDRAGVGIVATPELARYMNLAEIVIRKDLAITGVSGQPGVGYRVPELIAATAGKIPLLGICLGHQALAQHFGAKIVLAQRIMHGKLSTITHDGKGLFAGLRGPFKAVRYHSLAAAADSIPECLEVTCRAEDGEVMGLRHKEALIEGIQYHPESILTTSGKTQISNFLKMVQARMVRPF